VHTLVIVGDHDWRGRTGADHPPLMVHHLEMDIKTKLFAVMPAIARDAHGEDHRPGGEVKFAWTVELEQTERGIRSFRRGFLCICLGL